MPALIALILLPLTLFNLLSGVVSGVWLAILGQWWALGIGIVAGIAHALLLVPIMGAGLLLLLATTGAMASRRAGAIVAVPLVFLTQVLIYGIVAAWCIGSFYIFMTKATHQTHIPLLVWSYGVAVAPWAAMTARDRQSGSAGASAVASLFMQIAYIATGLEVLFLPSTTPLTWLTTFLAIMAAGAILQTILGVASFISTRDD